MLKRLEFLLGEGRRLVTDLWDSRLLWQSIHNVSTLSKRPRNLKNLLSNIFYFIILVTNDLKKKVSKWVIDPNAALKYATGMCRVSVRYFKHL